MSNLLSLIVNYLSDVNVWDVYEKMLSRSDTHKLKKKEPLTKAKKPFNCELCEITYGRTNFMSQD